MSTNSSPQGGSTGRDSNSIEYVEEKGGNDALPTYQEATGAPVEVSSPLGYGVGAFTIVFMNINMMIGTGIYSTLLANYLFATSGHTGTDWQVKGVAIAGYTVVTICTGSAGAYGLTNALYRITFSYGGYNNAFNVVNEVKNPVKQLKRNAFAALFAVYVIYMFTNVAWFSAASALGQSLSDLAIYPSAVFNVTLAVGLYILRWRRNKAKLPRPEFRAWDPVVIFNILTQLYLFVMPWYPPKHGGADVSFWYGTYIVTGLGILGLCGIYYWVWAVLLPKWKGYKLRQEVLELGNGAQAHRITRVSQSELAEWDAVHDATGRLKQAIIVSQHFDASGKVQDTAFQKTEKVA
ncbi:high-affinity methionine permease [Niveomyces insectorum RCEF 264]|uniref:High-affinity methionine permease n=1 Tax=Niveomyces insectorum RCEF 264 TaxID=1081102 RepID=A0A162MLH5_9HYPO|nr:high-affinity methionine permease [Niveomyces insectorum RCEF 264]